MNGWRLRLFVGVEWLLARLGLKLPGKIMYIGGSDTCRRLCPGTRRRS